MQIDSFKDMYIAELQELASVEHLLADTWSPRPATYCAARPCGGPSRA